MWAKGKGRLVQLDNTVIVVVVFVFFSLQLVLVVLFFFFFFFFFYFFFFFEGNRQVLSQLTFPQRQRGR